MSRTTKTIKAHVHSATDPTTFPRKLKMAPKKLPMISGNFSTAFSARLLSASASLPNHFFKVLLSFDGEPPLPPPSPKAPAIARTIVEIIIEMTVSIGNIVMPCSRNKVRILYAKDVSLSRTFSRVCLILETCVWRSFRFCDSISRLACFSVFMLPNLSLYNCFCSSE